MLRAAVRSFDTICMTRRMRLFRLGIALKDWQIPEFGPKVREGMSVNSLHQVTVIAGNTREQIEAGLELILPPG